MKGWTAGERQDPSLSWGGCGGGLWLYGREGNSASEQSLGQLKASAMGTMLKKSVSCHAGARWAQTTAALWADARRQPLWGTASIWRQPTGILWVSVLWKSSYFTLIYLHFKKFRKTGRLGLHSESAVIVCSGLVTYCFHLIINPHSLSGWEHEVLLTLL